MADGSLVSIVGAAGTALGFLIRSAWTFGRKESSVQSKVQEHGDRLDKHGERLDKHDDRFTALNIEFVPRPEVQASLTAIQESQRESKQLLMHLVTKKPIEPTVHE